MALDERPYRSRRHRRVGFTSGGPLGALLAQRRDHRHRAAARMPASPRPDLDGLVTYNNLNEIMSAHLASVLGFRDLRFAADPMSGGGNLAAAALLVADAAVTAGYADHVVVFRAINQGGGRRYGRARFAERAAGEAAYRTPFGLSAPVAANASRHALHARPRRRPGHARQSCAHVLRPCAVQPAR